MTPPAPFAAACYDLGLVRLTPLGDDVEILAGRMATLDPWVRMGRPAASFVAYMNRPMAATFRFAVRLDTTPVGFVAIRYPFMRGPYIESIAVFPEAQRRGIARAIVEWMGREVAGEAANIWLCVTEWNQPARAFYASLGFTEIGPIPDVALVGQTEIFLRKALGPPLG